MTRPVDTLAEIASQRDWIDRQLRAQSLSRQREPMPLVARLAIGGLLLACLLSVPVLIGYAAWTLWPAVADVACVTPRAVAGVGP